MSSCWVFLSSYLVSESTEVLQFNEILHVIQFIKDRSHFLFHCSLLHHTTFHLVLDYPIWQKYRAVILDFFLSGVGGATPVFRSWTNSVLFLYALRYWRKWTTNLWAKGGHCFILCFRNEQNLNPGVEFSQIKHFLDPSQCFSSNMHKKHVS